MRSPEFYHCLGLTRHEELVREASAARLYRLWREGRGSGVARFLVRLGNALERVGRRLGQTPSPTLAGTPAHGKAAHG